MQRRKTSTTTTTSVSEIWLLSSVHLYGQVYIVPNLLHAERGVWSYAFHTSSLLDRAAETFAVGTEDVVVFASDIFSKNIAFLFIILTACHTLDHEGSE